MKIYVLNTLVLSLIIASTSVSAGKYNPFDDDDTEAPSPEPLEPTKPLISPVAPGPKKVYSCPDDNGAKYSTGDVIFELKCDSGTHAKRLRNSQANSQTECADLCAADPACQSCDWNVISKNCGQFSEYIPTTPNKGVHTWFPTKERTAPSNEDSNTPSCPKDEGKTYTATDGSFFKIHCQMHSNVNDKPTAIRSTEGGTFQHCMEECAKEPGCISIDYIGLPESMHTFKTCTLFSTGGGDKPARPCDDKTTNMAFLVDPPEEAEPDAGGVACSTECPYANGNVFDSTYGERFHIDCGRRHGSISITEKSTQPSFQACMNACAALIACHSIDYHISKKLCYFGNHHAEPSHFTPGWASAHSLGCAGACSSQSTCACPGAGQ